MFKTSVLVLLLTVISGTSPAALNVKDYGAVGDGVNDDTQAIRDTIAAAQAQYRLSLPNCCSSAYPTRPEIVFPAGKYLISDSIYAAMGIIRGEGEAAIIQSDPTKKIFYTGWAWRSTFSGLTFVNGTMHLDLGNPNSDSGMVLIQQCRFYCASELAINIQPGTYSTILNIKDCVFIENEQVLINRCDQTLMRDCWISSRSTMANKAVIENRASARSSMTNVVLVPQGSGADRRWIDNYAMLACRNVVFGSDPNNPGSGGFTPVVNFAKFETNLYGPSIVLDRCQIAAWDNPARRCAVYCQEIPNQIIVQHSSLVNVPEIIVDPGIDCSTYFTGAAPGMLNFAVENNIGTATGSLPGCLENP
jgi:hypothetical protein